MQRPQKSPPSTPPSVSKHTLWADTIPFGPLSRSSMLPRLSLLRSAGSSARLAGTAVPRERGAGERPATAWPPSPSHPPGLFRERGREPHFVTGVNIRFSSSKADLSSGKPAVTNLVSSPCPSSSELSSQAAVLPYRSPQLLSSPSPWTLPTGETPLLGSKWAEDLGPNGSDITLFHAFFCNSKWLKQSTHLL